MDLHGQDERSLLGMKKVELVEMCRSLGLKVSGTKAELVGRLLPQLDAPEPPAVPEEPPYVPTGGLRCAADLSAAMKLAGTGVIREVRRYTPGTEMSLVAGDVLSSVMELSERDGLFAVLEYDVVLAEDPDPADPGTLRVQRVFPSPEVGYVTFDAVMSSRYARSVDEKFGSMLPDMSFADGNSARLTPDGDLGYDCRMLGAVSLQSEDGERRMPYGSPLRVMAAMEPRLGTAWLAAEVGGQTLSIGGTTRLLEQDLALLAAVKAAGISLDAQSGKLVIG